MTGDLLIASNWRTGSPISRPRCASIRSSFLPTGRRRLQRQCRCRHPEQLSGNPHRRLRVACGERRPRWPRYHGVQRAAVAVARSAARWHRHGTGAASGTLTQGPDGSTRCSRCAHELRTPLAAILSAMDVLARGHSDARPTSIPRSCSSISVCRARRAWS